MNGPNTGCRVVTIRLHKKDTAEAVVYTKKKQRASAELFARGWTDHCWTVQSDAPDGAHGR